MAGFVAPADDLLPAGGTTAFGDPLASVSAPGTRTVQDIGDAIMGGLQSSSAGLIKRGKLADKVLTEDAPWYHRAAYGAGTMLGDVPAMIPGAMAGGAMATAVTANPLVGAGGAMVGAFAVPQAIREALIQAYSTGHAVSWSDAKDIALAGLKGGAKGSVIGAATAVAGPVVGRTVGGVLAPGVGTALSGQAVSRITGTAITGAEIATMTTAASALEGHMPSAQDFMDNAILLGGVKGAMHVAKGLRAVYAETGKTPEEVRADAAVDPVLRTTVEAGRVPEQYAPLALEQRVQAALGNDPRPELVRKALADPNWKPTANEPPPVVTEYITDRASLAGVYGEVGKVYANEIQSLTRGVRTNKATMADAYAQVFGGKLEEHTAGMAANAETMAARLIVAKSALIETSKAAELLKQNPTDPTAKLKFYASVELLAQLQGEVRGAAAEWGRAGQIQRAIKYDPSMLLEAEGLLSHLERKTPMAKVAELFEQMRDPANRMRFAEDAMKAGFGEKVIEAWRAGLFSGPLTWEANVLGNTARWLVDIVEQPIKAGLTTMERAVAGDPLKAAQVKARAFAPFYGLQMAVMDGLHIAERGAALLKAEGLVEGGKKAAAAIGDVAGRNDERIDVVRRANEGALGKAVGFSFGMLKLQDLPFRTIGERAQAYIQAVDRATKEYHPNTREWREAVMKYTNDPAFGLAPEAAAKALKTIDQAGAEAVFAQDLGPRASRVSSAIAGTPWEFVFPARRTPVNLLDWALQHTPGFNFLSSRWREDFAAGGERKAAATARIVVGTAIAATAYGLAESGLLTGGNLADKETGRTKTGAGAQNYSIKVGNEYYSIQRIEPVAKVMMLAADLIEISKSPKITPEDQEKAKAMLVLAFANSTISTTYLSGLANLMKAALDPERYGENLVESYGSTVVPKIVGQTVTLADPYKREVDGALDAIQSQIPFLREKLVAQRDVWGEKLKNEKLFGVMPLQVTKESTEKVKAEAARLYLGIADAPKYAEESGPVSAKEKRTKLTQEERDVYREVAGKQALSVLSPIVNDPSWTGLPDFVQIEIYKDVLKDARKAGEQKALPSDDARREALREKVRRILDQQINEAQSRQPLSPK